jgi:DNA-binding FadR family transcriptional regulator
MTTPVPDAEDPGRYHPESAIRKFLVAKAASAQTPEVMTADLKTAAVHERWAVKTAADADAQGMTGQAPTPATIAELTALAVPALLPADGRSDGAEKTVWQLTATLQEFGREADGDYHMVLADAQGNTMIGEIPNPGDITSPSYFATQITDARTAFDGHFNLEEDISAPSAQAAPAPAGTTAFREAGATVTLTGLGFFDFAHGQRGVAPNAIELHPVIGITING